VKPLVVVEGPDAAVASAVAEIRRGEWNLVSGWNPPRGVERAVCTGTVASAEDAAAALLAVVAGAGVVIAGRADRAVLDRLIDDLRRFGPVDHRGPDAPVRAPLTGEEQSLLDLLAEGLSVSEAARRLSLSRRTAVRRLAAGRAKLGVETTAAAVIASRSSRESGSSRV
jgi:DNA-binding NarL/FixJ family response regulator